MNLLKHLWNALFRRDPKPVKKSCYRKNIAQVSIDDGFVEYTYALKLEGDYSTDSLIKLFAQAAKAEIGEPRLRTTYLTHLEAENPKPAKSSSLLVRRMDSASRTAQQEQHGNPPQ